MSAAVDERRVPLGLFADQPTPRLYDRVIEVLRVHHYSRRTEKAHAGWIRLIGLLLYGSGLRLLECLRLRVKDVDFALRQIIVREGKGDKDRRTMLPAAVIPELHPHLERVRGLHRHDLGRGLGAVLLPHALARKLPSASKDWAGAGFGYRDSPRLGAGEQDSPPAGPRTQPIPATTLAPYGSPRRHP